MHPKPLTCAWARDSHWSWSSGVGQKGPPGLDVEFWGWLLSSPDCPRRQTPPGRRWSPKPCSLSLGYMTEPSSALWPMPTAWPSSWMRVVRMKSVHLQFVSGSCLVRISSERRTTAWKTMRRSMTSRCQTSAEPSSWSSSRPVSRSTQMIWMVLDRGAGSSPAVWAEAVIGVNSQAGEFTKFCDGVPGGQSGSCAICR